MRRGNDPEWWVGKNMEGGGHGQFQCAYCTKILSERLKKFKMQTVLFTKQQKDQMGGLYA
jgi:hypothetical protein